MKTILVTGATSGIGLAVSRALALQGHRVLGVGRTWEHCIAAKKDILAAAPGAQIAFFQADLLEQSRIWHLAGEVRAYLDTYTDGILDALINNAGGVRSQYKTTAEGYEHQFALNHLAGFLLTRLLLPCLLKQGGRVLFTGSRSHMHTRVHWRDIMFEKCYNCLSAYKQSKLCNLLFARELNRRYAGKNLHAYVVDPGLVRTDIGNKQTGGLISAFWSLRKTYGDPPDVPARTYVYICEQTPAPTGLYYYGRLPRRYSKQAKDTRTAMRLFSLSEQLCGIRYEE